jgi:hypothetical protein
MEPLGGSRSVRQALGGITVAKLIERKVAPRRDFLGPRCCGRIVGKELLERKRSPQSVLGVRFRLPAGSPHRHAVANAGQDVLQIAPLRSVIEHLHGSDDGNIVSAGPLAQSRFLRYFGIAAVSCRHRIESITKSLA